MDDMLVTVTVMVKRKEMRKGREGKGDYEWNPPRETQGLDTMNGVCDWMEEREGE